MRTIRVSLWGQLKLLAQADSVNLAVAEPTTVDDVIRSLVDSFDALKGLLINNDGTCRKSILVFVDGVQWSWDTEGILKDGADVTLMSPIAGG